MSQQKKKAKASHNDDDDDATEEVQLSDTTKEKTPNNAKSAKKKEPDAKQPSLFAFFNKGSAKATPAASTAPPAESVQFSPRKLKSPRKTPLSTELAHSPLSPSRSTPAATANVDPMATTAMIRQSLSPGKKRPAVASAALSAAAVASPPPATKKTRPSAGVGSGLSGKLEIDSSTATSSAASTTTAVTARTAIQVDARHQGAIPKSLEEQSQRAVDAAAKATSATKAAAKTSPDVTPEEKARRRASYRAFISRDTRPPNAGNKEVPEGAPNCLAGKSFLITGVLDSLERTECEALILKHGGKVAKSVTKALNYAIIGTEPGASKMKQLDERSDVKRLNEDELFDLIRSAAITPELAKKIAADKEKAAVKKQKEFEAEAARVAAQVAATTAATAATVAAKQPAKPLDPLQEAALAALRAAEEAARRKLAPPPTAVTTAVTTAAPTRAVVAAAAATAAPPPVSRPQPAAVVSPPKSAMVGSRAAASLMSAASSTSTAAASTTVAAASSSSASTTSATPAAATNLLWVDLFKPKGADDLIGNPGIHTTLLSWLKGWNAKTTEKRAVLLSGAPGIGKSSAAHILAREAGYVPIEFNASDTRNQKSVLLTVGEMVNTHGMSEFMGRAASTAATTLKAGDKPCVIMDEVDGMSAGDRGGTTALIALIKKTLVPIICICNDRQSTKVRSLRNYCKELQYKKPMWSQASTRLMVIAKLRNLRVDALTMERIFTACNGDIRQTLTMLQMWSDGSGTKLAAATPRAVGQSAKAPVDDRLAAQLASTAKEATLGPFEALRRLFEPVAAPTPNNRREFDNALDLFWNDRDMMPLFVHENYPRQQPDLFRSQTSRMARRQLGGALSGKSDLAHLELLAMTADSLSTGAAVESVLRRTQDYSLANLAGALSCAVPAALLRSATPSNGLIEFPSYLGQFSKARKANRLAGELHSRMRSTISATVDDVALDYVPALIGPLTQPLITQGRDGIPAVIVLMDEYGLMRDDWDSVCDLRFIESDNDPRKLIESTVKSAFTRTYNASAHAVRAVGATGTKRSAADVHILVDDEAGDDGDDDNNNGGGGGGDTGAGDGDDDDGSDEDDKAADLKDDALIKRKEAPKKRKAAGGEDGASSTTSSKAKRGRAKK